MVNTGIGLEIQQLYNMYKKQFQEILPNNWPQLLDVISYFKFNEDKTIIFLVIYILGLILILKFTLKYLLKVGNVFSFTV